MNCETAREEMLVAEMEELRGEADTTLSMHLRSCSECRTRADAIVAGYAAMATALPAMSAARTVEPLPRKPKSWLWVPLPLAAAAAMALLIVTRQGTDSLPNVDAVARMMFRETPLVAPPAGKQAMVIEKNDMTIVWLYQQETL